MLGLTPFNRRNRGVDIRPRDLFDEFEDFFDSFFNESLFPAIYNNRRSMRVDIKENENEYIVEAELPGVDKDEINLELNDDILTISVERNEQVNEERENYIRRERRAASMQRSFRIDNVKHEDVTANFKNGILTVTLPKKEPGKRSSRKINIK